MESREKKREKRAGIPQSILYILYCGDRARERIEIDIPNVKREKMSFNIIFFFLYIILQL